MTSMTDKPCELSSSELRILKSKVEWVLSWADNPVVYRFAGKYPSEAQQAFKDINRLLKKL